MRLSSLFVGLSSLLFLVTACEENPASPPAPSCVETICTAGSGGCAGNAVWSCAADGKTRIYSECGSAQYCEGGVCKQRGCTYIGSSKCIGDGTVSTCSMTGHATNTETCSASTVCRGGECVSKSCDDGEERCSASGIHLLSCQGGEWTAQPCEGPTPLCFDDASAGPACKARVCEPQTARCIGDTSYQCDVTGHSETEVQCTADEVCKEGYCLPTVCGLDDHDAGSTPDGSGDAYDPPDPGPGQDIKEQKDVYIPPLEPIARIEFKLMGIKQVFDLNARADYIVVDQNLKLSAGKSMRKLEINIFPIEPFTVGSWDESDGGEIGVLICYFDAQSLDPAIQAKPCAVGFSHASVAYTVTLDKNNGPDSWLQGTFTATLKDTLENYIELEEGVFEVLHK